MIDAVLASKVRTKLGRVRATYLLNRFGTAVPRAVEAYLYLLNDRNVGVGSPLGIPRGLNELWDNGGIRYAPPIH